MHIIILIPVLILILYSYLFSYSCVQLSAGPVLTRSAQLVVRKFNALLGMPAAVYEESFGLQLDFGDVGGAETRVVTDANKAEYVAARYVLTVCTVCQYVALSLCDAMRSAPLSRCEVNTRSVDPLREAFLRAASLGCLLL